MVTAALLALDVDGTLVGPDGVCSVRNREALASAVSDGVEVLFVTARPARTVAPLARLCDLGGRAICSLGAVLYDLDTATIDRSRPLSAETVVEVVARLRAAVPRVALGWETTQGMYVEAAYPLSQDARRNAILADSSELDTPVLHIFARHPSDDGPWMLAARKAVSGLVETAHWSSGVLDITARGVSKLAALRAYCADRGIPPGSVAAIGDTEVDVPMMRWAGTGIAVGDAARTVRAAADWVVAPCAADGVAEALGRLTAPL